MRLEHCCNDSILRLKMPKNYIRNKKLNTQIIINSDLHFIFTNNNKKYP